MLKRFTLLVLLTLLSAAFGFPAQASCIADRQFFAPYSYVYTPGIVGGQLDSTVTTDFDGFFWALGAGHPAGQAGIDNGNFAAIDGNSGGWLTIRPPVGGNGYPPAIDSSWNASPLIDGCIDTTGSDPAAPDQQQCMVALFADQHSGAGFYAVSSAPADGSGNYDLTVPGDQPILLAEVPRPNSGFDPYVDDPTNTLTIGPPTLDEAGQYIHPDCPEVIAGYRVYRQIVASGSAVPVDRAWDDGSGVGWEVALGGQLPSGQPLPLTQAAELTFSCAERSDVYLAYSLVFDSGYETPHLSRNHLTFPIDCCSDADGDGVCAEPSEDRDVDCDDSRPHCAVDCTDNDLDQYCSPGDCDDGQPAVHGDVAEVCDGIDNNCDGRSDETPVALGPVMVTGTASAARFGVAVAALGDVDGDGYDDFIVGAALDTADGMAEAGSATVFSGHSRTPLQRVLHPDPQTGDRFGGAVERIGDVNLDGFDDILIGADGDDTAAAVDAGSAFVFSGSGADAFELLHTLDDPAGGAADGLGQSVAALGDHNGDGTDDLAVGAPGADGERGRVLVFSGAGGNRIRILTDPGGQSGDRYGCAVAGVGDLDASDTDEVLIASCGGDSPVAGGTGSVTVIAGDSWLPIATLFDPLGEPGDRFGESLTGLGDVDGDGIDDVLIGAGGDDDPTAGVDAGSAFLFSGATQLLIHRLAHPQGAAGDRFGARVADVGDLDGDRSTDIGVGAPADDTGDGVDAGSIALFSSATGQLIRRLEAQGGSLGAAFGSALTLLGNVDDDGVGDLAVGAPGGDSATGSGTGDVDIFSGAGTEDADGDGHGDLCDCAPQDSTAQFPPEELNDLTLTLSPMLLTWTDPGVGFRFDVIGGLLSALRADAGFAAAICIIDDAPGVPVQDDQPTPSVGEGYYYLPRAQNACGDGGYGKTSGGVQRQPGNDCL